MASDAMRPVPFGRLPVQPIIAAGRLRLMLPADAKLYLALVAHRRGVGDVVWPSYGTLAAMTGLTPRAIIRATRRLARLGLIRIEVGGGRGRSNRYRIVEAVGNGDSPFTVSQPQMGDGKSLPAPEKGERRRPQTVTGEARNSEPGFTRSILEREKEKDKAPSAHGFSLPFDTAEFKSGWADWTEHCRAIGHKLNPRIVQRQLADLRSLGHARAVEAMRASIRNGYWDLYPPDVPGIKRGLPPLDEWLKKSRKDP